MNTYSSHFACLFLFFLFFLSLNITDKSKQGPERHATHMAYNNTYSQVNYRLRHITGMGNDQQCKHESLKRHSRNHYSMYYENTGLQKATSDNTKSLRDTQDTLKCLLDSQTSREELVWYLKAITSSWLTIAHLISASDLPSWCKSILKAHAPSLDKLHCAISVFSLYEQNPGKSSNTIT